jgi:hypothetical protein
MAKSVVVTSESDSGRNQKFLDNKTGKDMTRTNFSDYHVRNVNGLPTPVSNPDRKESNNLD